MPALARTNPEKPVLLPVAQDLLRDAMRARGKTVTALAAELGVSRKHLSSVLNRHSPVAMPLLRRLGETLGVEPELLACLLDHGPEARPDPYGLMPGWIVAHGDRTKPMAGWEMLED